ncbi:hypothetical protein DCAR_0934573 [Daucus carota subsp. sativus]|uniref:Myb/SANT-like domain-containing protein n=1 Tax=Daucus carota subsp. sativus TaxID=79200 RepID=A0A162B694_DAUCS|nr:hypothetical protein DCAR_0934573 [Daucus carota subsp. sativus]
MEESGVIGNGRGRNKRFWTAEEDTVLVSALLELASDPHWKCDNGFRNGYMVRLEEIIGKALPTCGLKATPHIDSRLKTLVSKFRAIAQMLSTSGFMWDDDRKMISVDRSVYDEYCKTHTTCKNLYGVAFPHFHELMTIYGKDYATGKPAEGFVDAVNSMEKAAPIQVTLDSSDEEIDVSGNVTQLDESEAPPSKKAKVEKTKKIGKKSESVAASEISSLQSFMKDMNVHLSTMANVMSRADEREQELAEKSEKVIEELLSFNLEGVTTTQVFEVADILTSQPNKLMIFNKCPSSLKAAFVKNLIGENSRRSD